MSTPAPLTAFLASLGPDFDASFIAEHLGSASLDDIVELTVEISELQELVEQGMKPIHRNKLWSAIVKERDIRCTHASNRVLLNDFVASNSKVLDQKAVLGNPLTVGPQSVAVTKGDQSPKNTADDEAEKKGAVGISDCDPSLGAPREAEDVDADNGDLSLGAPDAEDAKFDGVLTDSTREAAKTLFQCVAGLLNSPDAGVRGSWESKATSLSVIKAAEEWGSRDARVSTLFSVKTLLIGLSNALRSGAIPIQGQVVLLGLHTNLMTLEYGLTLEHSSVWQRARTRVFASLSGSVDAVATDIDCAKLPAPLPGKLYEHLNAYAMIDFGPNRCLGFGKLPNC
jgi:hypothetical protein